MSARALDIVQKPCLFLGRVQPPCLDRLGALHHLGGFVADVAAVGAQAGVAHMLLGLGFVRPAGGAPGRLVQPPDIRAQAVVLGLLKSVLTFFICKPGREIAFLQGYIRFIDRQNMIHTAVEKRSVV